MPIEFKDNSIKVKDALKDAAIAYLHEVAGEVTSQTKQNVPTGGGYYSQQKGAWTYKVDESKLEATIGNPMQQAIWTELGTGEFALNGDGRKGWWVYVKGSGDSTVSNGGKTYTKEEAKRIVAMMRADGLDAHMTHGQTPKRPLFIAYTTLKAAIIRRAEEVLESRLRK